jgi:hypothetical protein
MPVPFGEVVLGAHVDVDHHASPGFANRRAPGRKVTGFQVRFEVVQVTLGLPQFS